MNIDFQDRIDEYVLGSMSDEDKLRFESEVSQDEKKKEQLELTQNVRAAIRSRQEKLAALAKMKDKYDEKHHVAAIALKPTGTDACRPCATTPEPVKMTKSSHKNIWLWMSGIAAVLVIGFFVVTPFVYETKPHYDASPQNKQNINIDKKSSFDIQQQDTITNDSILTDIDSIQVQ